MDARSSLLVLALGLCLAAALQPLSAQEAGGPSKSNRIAAEAKAELRYVRVDQARVYAGPSHDYYPTSLLKQGEAVEVYERTDDGWLAIRPPRGSFSWLPATQGFLLPGGRVVEVTDAAAVSWIGSSLGTAKQYRWQVRLGRGEQLAVIGEQTISDDESDKKTLWYKITPPNGEFRWIEEAATTLDAPSGAEAVIQAVDLQARNDDEGETADTEARDGTHSVLEASAEVALPPALSAAAGGAGHGRAHSRGQSSQSSVDGDRWNTWHAMEFKNGSFSFPGIARMLGMEPATSHAPSDTYDPFDLAAAPTKARRQSANPIQQDAGIVAGDPLSAQAADAETGQLAARRKRGWRDPRDLRERRELAGSSGQTFDGLDSDVQLAGGTSALTTLIDMLGGDNNQAIGSAVVPASANVAHASGGTADDTQWYGIVQAPQASNYQALELQHADLSEVQARLSEMVSGPEHTWNLAPLADRTRYLIEHGVTAIERGEARLMLDRIEAFADVARRSTELGMTPPVALAASVNASISASPVASAATRWASPLGLTSEMTDVPTGSAPRFDATGWIVPVHSSNRDMPSHALTNDSGKIIVYLSPAAGVNLARYQGQAVGVYGLRGYLPQLKANHIQVQRAVRLH